MATFKHEDPDAQFSYEGKAFPVRNGEVNLPDEAEEAAIAHGFKKIAPSVNKIAAATTLRKDDGAGIGDGSAPAVKPNLRGMSKKALVEYAETNYGLALDADDKQNDLIAAIEDAEAAKSAA